MIAAGYGRATWISFWHLSAVNGWAEHFCSAQVSDVDLFRYRQRIIHLDTQVSDSALELGVAEQELCRSQITGSAVNQRCLGPPQRVRAKNLRVWPYERRFTI